LIFMHTPRIDSTRDLFHTTTIGEYEYSEWVYWWVYSHFKEDLKVGKREWLYVSEPFGFGYLWKKPYLWRH